MPKPIVCLSAALRQFIELFRPCFSKRQWKYFVIVLLGLIECEGRRTLCGLLAVRWSVEVLFEGDKDLLGADRYQLMSAKAIVRFWTLIVCVGYFLDEQRVAQEALTTWGEARRPIQKEQQHNLLRWLESQFAAGLTAQQIGAQLAL